MTSVITVTQLQIIQVLDVSPADQRVYVWWIAVFYSVCLVSLRLIRAPTSFRVYLARLLNAVAKTEKERVRKIKRETA